MLYLDPKWRVSVIFFVELPPIHETNFIVGAEFASR